MDSARGLVVLRAVHKHTYQKADYVFLPIAAITAIDRLGAGEKAAVGSVGINEAQRRLRESMAAEERKLECRGVDVSEEEQRLFMALLKQCARARARAPPSCNAPHRRALRRPPCSYPRAKWDQQTMVLDDVGTTLIRPFTLASADVKNTNTEYKEYLRKSLSGCRASVGLAV